MTTTGGATRRGYAEPCLLSAANRQPVRVRRVSGSESAIARCMRVLSTRRHRLRHARVTDNHDNATTRIKRWSRGRLVIDGYY